MDEPSPLIQIVNEDDEPVGSATKAEAQRRGLIHRIVNIIVEDQAGRILLQKRAAKRELGPNQWDTSVGGHVDVGEDYLTAARREAFEELGLQDIELQELGSYHRSRLEDWRHLNRFYRVYRTVIPAETIIKPEAREIALVRWFSLEEVEQLIKQPDQVTGGIVETITRFYS